MSTKLHVSMPTLLYWYSTLFWVLLSQSQNTITIFSIWLLYGWINRLKLQILVICKGPCQGTPLKFGEHEMVLYKGREV